MLFLHENISCRYSLEVLNVYLQGMFWGKNNKLILNYYLSSGAITKTCLYYFDPLKPHFYTVKLGFTGVYVIFLIFARKHRLVVLIRTALLSSSNEYPQSMF